jgi:hypothetical protein
MDAPLPSASGHFFFMEPRAVRPGHGWTWVVQGARLFRKSPGVWIALVLLLYASMNLLVQIPLLGVAFLLLMPVFIAGLMHGCRTLEDGGALQATHLLCGFRHNAAALVTIGGVWVVGNLAIMLLVNQLGGEEILAVSKMMAAAQGSASPQITPEMQASARVAVRALLAGTLASLPLMMAVMYAPLLVYFDDLKPLGAMKASLAACLKNALPLLVYGLVIFAGMFITLPVSIALRRFDLALWLLAPVILPSIYASYKDVFLYGPAAEARTDSVAG